MMRVRLSTELAIVLLVVLAAIAFNAVVVVRENPWLVIFVYWAPQGSASRLLSFGLPVPSEDAASPHEKRGENARFISSTNCWTSFSKRS
jgi:hypothetical protein